MSGAEWELGPIQAAPTICDKCGRPNDEHPNVCPGMSGEVVVVSLDIPRAPKWMRVQPGHVIPAGQPYRIEYQQIHHAIEDVQMRESLTVVYQKEHSGFFVDSSWKPPLVLPTEPSVIRANVYGTERVLFGPLRDEKDWCRADDGYAVSPEDIISFEVLWTEKA